MVFLHFKDKLVTNSVYNGSNWVDISCETTGLNDRQKLSISRLFSACLTSASRAYFPLWLDDGWIWARVEN